MQFAKCEQNRRLNTEKLLLPIQLCHYEINFKSYSLTNRRWRQEFCAGWNHEFYTFHLFSTDNLKPSTLFCCDPTLFFTNSSLATTNFYWKSTRLHTDTHDSSFFVLPKLYTSAFKYLRRKITKRVQMLTDHWFVRWNTFTKETNNMWSVEKKITFRGVFYLVFSFVTLFITCYCYSITLLFFTVYTRVLQFHSGRGTWTFKDFKKGKAGFMWTDSADR